jgi:hypothetical protein
MDTVHRRQHTVHGAVPPARAWQCLGARQFSHCALPGQRAASGSPTVSSCAHGKLVKSIVCARAAALDQLISGPRRAREGVGVVAAPAMAAERPASYATRYRAGSPQQPADRANGYSRCQMIRSQWRRLWCFDVASSRAGTMCPALPSRGGFCVHMGHIDAKQQSRGGQLALVVLAELSGIVSVVSFGRRAEANRRLPAGAWQ